MTSRISLLPAVGLATAIALGAGFGARLTDAAAEPDSLPSPAGISATASSDALVVSWDPMADAQRYRVRYRIGWQDWSDVVQTESPHVVLDGLSADTEYTVAIGVSTEHLGWTSAWTTAEFATQATPATTPAPATSTTTTTPTSTTRSTTTTAATTTTMPRGPDDGAHPHGTWLSVTDESAAYTEERTPTEYSFFDWRNETRPDWGPSRIGFLVQCDGVLVDQVDPIVDPGAPRSAHLHEFFGNPAVTPYSSTQSLADVSRDDVACTDVNDKSAYWSPVVYQDGTAVRATTFSAYYKSPVADVEPMPFGLRMVAGDAHASANQADMIGWWEIAGRKGINTRNSADMIERPADEREIQLRVNFPQCWDGMHLDSPDHRSHMAYADATDGCPATHPVRVPQLVTFTAYDVAGGSGFELASGDWYTFHQDFWNAWAPDQMAELTDRCIADGMMCRVNTTARLLGLGQYVDRVPAG